jgi:hypothetical protein
MPLLVLATRKELEGLGGEIVGQWMSRELDYETLAKFTTAPRSRSAAM